MWDEKKSAVRLLLNYYITTTPKMFINLRIAEPIYMFVSFYQFNYITKFRTVIKYSYNIIAVKLVLHNSRCIILPRLYHLGAFISPEFV